MIHKILLEFIYSKIVRIALDYVLDYSEKMLMGIGTSVLLEKSLMEMNHLNQLMMLFIY